MAIRLKGQTPRKITPNSLESEALLYLQRYATSAANLRRVLMRRVQRAAYAHDNDPLDSASLVEALVDRFVRSGMLDDRAYAEGRAASLHRRGVSRHRIAARLTAKGVALEDIADALSQLRDAHADLDLDAACNCARRRRLGPWRLKERAERRERDLAALARQGFGYELAIRVIDAADIASLEAELNDK
jgi:regulatory protein